MDLISKEGPGLKIFTRVDGNDSNDDVVNRGNISRDTRSRGMRNRNSPRPEGVVLISLCPKASGDSAPRCSLPFSLLRKVLLETSGRCVGAGTVYRAWEYGESEYDSPATSGVIVPWLVHYGQTLALAFSLSISLPLSVSLNYNQSNLSSRVLASDEYCTAPICYLGLCYARILCSRILIRR